MNLASVMAALATELDKIDGLRVYGWPADQVAAPAAVVGYPSTYSFDQTFGRGSDRMTIPVFVLVGRVDDRTARDVLGAYVDGSGAKSVKAKVEAGSYSAMDSVRVVDVEFLAVSVGGVEYLAAEFSVDVFG